MNKFKHKNLFLKKSLIKNFIKYKKLITISSRLKAIKPFIEKLITLGKNPNLFNLRLICIKLSCNYFFAKRIILISKKYLNLNGGYTRLLKLGFRKGDGAHISILTLL